ncbi:MAG: DUF2892 domain-containing protein [Exilibacterium sp.]
MTINEGLRLVAGVFVLASVVLGYYINPWFFAFTAFVALNLIQSAFSHWCPMMWLLDKLGLKKECIVSDRGTERISGSGQTIRS